MAGMLNEVIGPFGYWIFIIRFWGAVSTSMLGVWQGIPYLFCDFIALYKKLPSHEHKELLKSNSFWYRFYLLFLAIPPMILLFLKKPFLIIILYSVLGALFMPFLAGTLLYMNSKKKWVGENMCNSILTNFLLLISIILFGYLGIQGLLNKF